MNRKIEYWLDTNEIIYFLRTNKYFSPRIRKLVMLAGQGRLALKLSPLVIFECTFVLMGPQFRLKKTDIAIALLSFINLKGIEAEEKLVLEETLHHFTKTGIDFVDAYLAAHAKAVSPPNVVSTNKKDFKQLGVSVETPDEVLQLLDSLNDESESST